MAFIRSLGSLFSSQLHHRLAMLTLALVVFAGAAQMFLAGAALRWQEIPHTVQDFRAGRTTGAIDKQLDQNMPWRAGLIGVANGLRYRLTGGAGDQVRVGRDGWLFLSEELRYEPQGPAHLQVRADLLSNASKALETRGVRLVLVLVPDKARVYPQHLRAQAYPAYQQGRYSETLTALRQRGLLVVDVLADFERAPAARDLYYRTDTHWNQSGARLAAQAVAQAVRPVHLEQSLFVTRQQGSASLRSGDLIRLMGLEGMPQCLRPASDLEASAVTQPTGSGGVSLFGDARVPVVLVGTSYSLRGNFHGYLQEALSASVLNAAKDGGGFLQAATQYLQDDAFTQSKPAVLVWEIPERFMYADLHEEKDWLRQLGWAP